MGKISSTLVGKLLTSPGKKKNVYVCLDAPKANGTIAGDEYMITLMNDVMPSGVDILWHNTDARKQWMLVSTDAAGVAELEKITEVTSMRSATLFDFAEPSISNLLIERPFLDIRAAFSRMLRSKATQPI